MRTEMLKQQDEIKPEANKEEVEAQKNTQVSAEEIAHAMVLHLEKAKAEVFRYLELANLLE